MHLQESGEMYLETIYILSKENPTVRSIDIVHELDFSKPSVSIAMRNLRERRNTTTLRGGRVMDSSV